MYETGNGGNLVLMNNDFQLSGGLFNNVYLCLFGGNREGHTQDAVLPGEERNDWLGNELLYSDDADVQFNSRFEEALLTTPLTSAGRASLERTALQDLQPLRSVADVSVEVVLTDVDKLELRVVLTELETNIPTEFLFVWDQTANEIVVNSSI